MKKRHRDEKASLTGKLDSDARSEEKKLNQELDMHKEKILREKRNKQATELAARQDLSQEEVQAVSLI